MKKTLAERRSTPIRNGCYIYKVIVSKDIVFGSFLPFHPSPS